MKILPTEIIVNNLSNPTLKVSNDLIDAHIRDFKKYKGYISIGGKLPEKFASFNNEPGLNIYLSLNSINEDFLNFAFVKNNDPSIFELNMLAFDVKNFKFYDNDFFDLAGMFDFSRSEVNGNLTSEKLNLDFRMDKTGFMRMEINDSIIPNLSFLNATQPASDFVFLSLIHI